LKEISANFQGTDFGSDAAKCRKLFDVGTERVDKETKLFGDDEDMNQDANTQRGGQGGEQGGGFRDVGGYGTGDAC
jgi:hypothetical protein